MHRFRLTILCAIAACLLAPAVASAQLSGRVLDAATSQPVSGTLVWLGGATAQMTRTDSVGEYRFDGIRPGSYCIQVSSPAHDDARVCVALSTGARMSVDLPVTMRPVTIAPIVVRGRRGRLAGDAGAPPDSAMISARSQQLDIIGARTSTRSAARLGDLTRNTDNDPGGGPQPHALYIFGSSAERGRVLLDGASLSAPLHLGALLPPFDPQVVEQADVRTGGISPRYDGGTAYIMDITTRRAGDRRRTWGEVDMLAGRVGAETPINGRGRVLVSGRRVNDEIIDELVAPRFGYGYRDALVRADVDIGETHGIHVTAFGTSETVGIPRDLAEDRASWQNRALTLMWSGIAEDDTERTVTLSASRGVADLPLLSAIGGHLEATLDRYGAVAEQQWTAGNARIEAGAELEHHVFARRASATQDPLNGEDRMVACTPELPCSSTSTTIGSLFAGALLNPRDGLTASFGLRAMYDRATGTVHALPRASFTFLPDDRHSVTLTAGRFSQPFAREPADSTERASVDIASATHVEVEVARRTGALHLRGNMHLRRHDRIEPTSRPRTVPGVELSLTWEMENATLAMAYDVSRGGVSGRSRTQHLASVAAHARYGRLIGSITTAYGAGLPLTSIVLDRPQAPEPLLQPPLTSTPSLETAGHDTRSPDYLRVDSWIGAEWRLNVDDRVVTVLPYVRIINALGQRESLFYYQENDLTRPPRALARVPAVPVAGIRWIF